MAMREAQKEMAIILFAKAFAAADENGRKELYIQFADAYEGSIRDWKVEVEDAFKDEELKEAFRKLDKRTEQKKFLEFVTIEALKKEDLEQISYLATKELNMMPWIEMETGPDSINDFVNSGYSYVAKREKEVLGFILAYKCPTFGGRYFLYIDTIVVNGDVQGNGIGKMLLQKVREGMFKNRILRVELMTKKEMPAYKIYKHLGFEDVEDYVHMQHY